MQEEITSIGWLIHNLNREHLVLLDASPEKTASGAASKYQDVCIPGTRLFSIKENFTNKENRFPNTIPSPQQFERQCQLLGINKDSEIVVYDNRGVYSSPRVWWLFKVMGHEKVSVLDGGLREWLKQGGPKIVKQDVKTTYALGDFKTNFNEEQVISYEEVIQNIEEKKFLIIDARSSGRFSGIDPEPRKHLSSGSIPNSINIPYTSVLENGVFKSRQAISHIFRSKVSSQQDLVFSCGSGLTACIIMLACNMTFRQSYYLFDGSWSEFAECIGLTEPIDE